MNTIESHPDNRYFKHKTKSWILFMGDIHDDSGTCFNLGAKNIAKKVDGFDYSEMEEITVEEWVELNEKAIELYKNWIKNTKLPF